ncbi:endonuclease domain-containing protein [Hanstruepera neustonica]|uniref:endonuclease domain-containing protein n=1 Tax=Hanstruepera neustonica TaxID=1445657 RepID=UPI001FAF3C22|nr:endonuclease domain-containing protein [Hanstruepera neustonica]
MYGYDFHRQKPIDEYIVDFFCNKLQLAIECDGYSHEILETYEKDVKKTKRLNTLRIHVLRFSDFQIMNDIENVLRAIEDYILKFEENSNTPPSIPPF